MTVHTSLYNSFASCEKKSEMKPGRRTLPLSTFENPRFSPAILNHASAHLAAKRWWATSWQRRWAAAVVSVVNGLVEVWLLMMVVVVASVDKIQLVNLWWLMMVGDWVTMAGADSQMRVECCLLMVDHSWEWFYHGWWHSILNTKLSYITEIRGGPAGLLGDSDLISWGLNNRHQPSTVNHQQSTNANAAKRRGSWDPTENAMGRSRVTFLVAWFP